MAVFRVQKTQNYTVMSNHHLNDKYPVLRPPGKERFVRFKTLGKRYTPEAIQTRILYPRTYRPYVENTPVVQHSRLRSEKKPRRKLTGLRALYYRYLYELGALPRKPRRPSYAVRQDAYKLDHPYRWRLRCRQDAHLWCAECAGVCLLNGYY